MELVPYPFFSPHRAWARTLIYAFPIYNAVVPWNHYWHVVGVWNPEYDRRICLGHLIRMGLIGGYNTLLIPFLRGMNPLTPGYKALKRSRFMFKIVAIGDFIVAMQYASYWWVYRSTIRLD